MSGDNGVTGLSTALEVSGGAAVVVAMSADASFLPSPTRPCTSCFTCAGLSEPENLSASSKFCGARLAIASSTALMNAALSKSPGCAWSILSALASLPCATLSSGGGFAAACTAPASA